MNLYTVLLTVTQIANMLMVNEETVRKWIKNGELNTITLLSKKDGYFVTEDSFIIFLEKHLKYNKIYHKLSFDGEDIYRVRDLIRDKLYGAIPAKEYTRIVIMLYGANHHDLLFKHVSTKEIINILLTKSNNVTVTQGVIDILTNLS